ncbi:hypothetical protein JCM10908_007093 [Rhodotorula pacifica]|uniref:putative peptide hydrolase n=1 Tax=Rhodotorula pacifica TaxID=1495444 RepID=UPI003180755E
MCGRFALGAHAEQLAVDIHQQYFVPPSPQPHQGAPHTGTGRSNAGSSGSGARASQENSGNSDASVPCSSAATHEHAVAWASLEAQSSFRPRYNVAPTTRVPVLRRSKKSQEVYELDLLKWGLVPHWYSDPPAPGLSTINATCESVFQGTPAWRGPRQDKRCVVLAQGFYEWLDKGKEKQPYFVKRKDGRLMALAGLWDHCDYKGKHDPVTSFTIMTVPVSSQLSFLHTRMPAILSDPSAIEQWLSAEPWSDKLKALIRPLEEEGVLEWYAVDRGVGKVQNDSEEFVKPLAQKKGSLDTLFAKQAAKSSPPSSSSHTKPSSSLKRLKHDFPTLTSSEKRAAKNEEEKEEEDKEAMNPDEDQDEQKLAKVEEEVEKLRPDHADAAGEGRKKSSEKRKRVVKEEERSAEERKSRNRKGKEDGVEVIDLLGDSDSNSSTSSEAEEAAHDSSAPASSSSTKKRRKRVAPSSTTRTKTPPTKRRKNNSGSTTAKEEKEEEAEGENVIVEEDGTVRHTDGKGNEELTDFFKKVE